MAAAEPFRVLFTRSDMQLAGPGRLMLAQANALRERGVQVTFATGGGQLALEASAQGFTHHEIPGLRVSERSIRATATLYRIITSLRPNVVHAFNAHAGMCAKPGALRVGAAVFSSVTGRGKERYLPLLPLHYIAVSEFVRTGLISFRVPRGRITVIPNATIADASVAGDAELARLETARADAENAGVIELCGVAMFAGSKGQDLVIDVLAEAVSRGEDRLRLTLVGDGPHRAQCELQAKRLHVADYCDFVGAQNDVQPFLDRASVFIHLSREETFGLVLAEAGARGLPVVTHRVGGIPEVVIDQRTGVIAPYCSIPDITTQLLQLIDDPAKRTRMGRNGRDRVSEQYRTSNSAEQLLALYGAKFNDETEHR